MKHQSLSFLASFATIVLSMCAFADPAIIDVAAQSGHLCVGYQAFSEACYGLPEGYRSVSLG